MSEKPAKQPKRAFQSPKGTRDFYPEEMLRRRYIVDSWRRVALRHGFEEIDGPTFEHLDLYTVKSGEGIVSELFSFQRAGGEDTYALRPEFTPTLARMYAARARQLPQPTKWFCVSNFFRAERPQRGRLREFFQWNCDVIGGDDAGVSNGETVECNIAICEETGLSAESVNVRFFDRRVFEGLFDMLGIEAERRAATLVALDKRGSTTQGEFEGKLTQAIGGIDRARLFLTTLEGADPQKFREAKAQLEAEGNVAALNLSSQMAEAATSSLKFQDALRELNAVYLAMGAERSARWLQRDPSIVRGLAYYTGMVFEVIAEGERAVAGGGRYDNLIELFGGPPTPACGFGMGDVVLANLLEDRGLMPSGREMLEALSRPMPLRPDVFVVAGPTEGASEQVVPLVARLRRGEEADGWREKGVKPWGAERYRVPPLHARRSYKATKNIGKLLADANACHARFAVIIENPERCTLKDLDRSEQRDDVPISDVGAIVAGVC